MPNTLSQVVKRDRLAAVFKDPETLRQVENLFAAVYQLVAAGGAVDAASMSADTAIAAATSALAEILQLRADAETDAAALSARIEGLTSAIESLASQAANPTQPTELLERVLELEGRLAVAEASIAAASVDVCPPIQEGAGAEYQSPAAPIPSESGDYTPPLDLSLIDQQLTVGGLVMPKTSGAAILVDKVAPTYCWRDLTEYISVKGTGPAVPDFVAYRGTIYDYRFGSVPPNNHLHEAFLNFHIPHDYVLGTDLYAHIHWTQNVVDTGGTAGVPGVAKWYFDITYAKGHGTPGGAADPFIAPITTSVTQQASTTQYGHLIAETVITDSGASLLNRANIEPDGIIQMRLYRDPLDVADTLDQDAFVKYVDIHYQSSNIGTKAKIPNFYV